MIDPNPIIRPFRLMRPGTFTGTDSDQKGYFDMSSTGTLFLDEGGYRYKTTDEVVLHRLLYLIEVLYLIFAPSLNALPTMLSSMR